MANGELNEELSQIVDRLTLAEETEQQALFEMAIGKLESSELALLLESLPVDRRQERWLQIPAEEQVQVLVAMRHEPRQTILKQLTPEALQLLLSGLDAEDLIELAETLPDTLVDDALARMDAQQRAHYQRTSLYTEEQIGRYVDHNLLLLPHKARISEARRLLRRQLPDHTDSIYLVDRTGRYAGLVPVGALLNAPAHQPVSDLLDRDPSALSASMELIDAAEKVEHSNRSALPVVDEKGYLVGRCTVRLALEIIRETYESQLMATAGMSEEEDLFAPVIRSSRRRATWLGINLLTAFLASWTIGLFAHTLEQVVALAVLMPIVASMGGIAGSQTLTLIIRGLAMGQITPGNARALLRKELGVGGLNGLLWALVIGLCATFWFASTTIGLVIALAIIINIAVAALAGVGIPLLLEKLDIDPALSGSVILTTVTDVVGFLAFLGLGTLLLL